MDPVSLYWIREHLDSISPIAFYTDQVLSSSFSLSLSLTLLHLTERRHVFLFFGVVVVFQAADQLSDQA